jgi:hypothetical protein
MGHNAAVNQVHWRRLSRGNGPVAESGSVWCSRREFIGKVTGSFRGECIGKLTTTVSNREGLVGLGQGSSAAHGVEQTLLALFPTPQQGL